MRNTKACSRTNSEGDRGKNGWIQFIKMQSQKCQEQQPTQQTAKCPTIVSKANTQQTLTEYGHETYVYRSKSSQIGQDIDKNK